MHIIFQLSYDVNVSCLKLTWIRGHLACSAFKYYLVMEQGRKHDRLLTDLHEHLRGYSSQTYFFLLSRYY